MVFPEEAWAGSVLPAARPKTLREPGVGYDFSGTVGSRKTRERALHHPVGPNGSPSASPRPGIGPRRRRGGPGPEKPRLELFDRREMGTRWERAPLRDGWLSSGGVSLWLSPEVGRPRG